MDGAAEVHSPNIVAVYPTLEARLVIEKIIGIESFIAKEIIGAAVIIASAALRDDVDQRAAVIAVLGGVVITKNFHFRDGILIDAHAQFVRAARLAAVQTVHGSDRGTAALSRDVG